VLKLH